MPFMSENNQPFDRHDENADSITAEPSVDLAGTDASANDNTDPITERPDVRPAGTCKRVANAALAGATLGAVAGAIAAALTGKGVADGVKAIVDGAADTVKEAAENVKSTIIEGAVGTVKGVTGGVNSTIEGTPDTVKSVADGVNSTLESDVGDLWQVSTPLEKERVVERTPPIDATKPVAPGKVDFHQGEVALDENDVTHGVANDATLNAHNSATTSDALLQMLLNQVGTQLARSFYEQLPAVVLAEIQRLATNPTLEEKQWITDRWAKSLEPLATAIILSGQSFNAGAASAATNGHKPLNHLEPQKI